MYKIYCCVESDDDDDVILIEDSGHASRDVKEDTDNDVVFICMEDGNGKNNAPLDLTNAVNKNVSQKAQDRNQADKDDEYGNSPADLFKNITGTEFVETDKNSMSVSNKLKRALASNDDQNALIKKYRNSSVATFTVQTNVLQNIQTTSSDRIVQDVNGNPSSLNATLSYSTSCGRQGNSSYNVNTVDPTYMTDILSLTSDTLDTHAQSPITQDLNISRKMMLSKNQDFSSAAVYKSVPPSQHAKTPEAVTMHGMLPNANCLSFTQFLSDYDPAAPCTNFLDQSAVCCVCENVGFNMSSCTDGHHTCSSCLETSVKFILCQRDKQVRYINLKQSPQTFHLWLC